MNLRRQTSFHVVSVEPRDGARGVLRDDPIVILLSVPVDADRLAEAAVEVREGEADVEVRLEAVAGGRVIVLHPLRALGAGREACLRVRGLRDARGREAPPLVSRFTTGAVSARELWP